MNILTKISIGFTLLYRRFTNDIRPVLVSWSVTNRCNQQCAYCHFPKSGGPELDEASAPFLIDELAKSGVRVLVLTGGEPLIRDDIENLINHGKREGMVVGINTNGRLVPEKLYKLANADFIQLSIDGPEQINDSLRQEDSFNATHLALKLLKAKGHKVKLNATITNRLEDHLDELLELVRQWGAPIMFHPLSTVHSGDIEISGIRMHEKQLYQFLGKVIKAKKEGAPIINSVPGLERLRGVPKRLPPKCYAGKLSVGVTPDGGVVICNQRRKGYDPVMIQENGFLEAVKNLPEPDCRQCWCANPMELNLAIDLDFDTILSALFSKL